MNSRCQIPEHIPAKDDGFNPTHGGNLRAAQAYFADYSGEWLDLSTGINALPYLLGDIPLSCLADLPYQSALFEQAVYAYYLGARRSNLTSSAQPSTPSSTSRASTIASSSASSSSSIIPATLAVGDEVKDKPQLAATARCLNDSQTQSFAGDSEVQNKQQSADAARCLNDSQAQSFASECEIQNEQQLSAEENGLSNGLSHSQTHIPTHIQTHIQEQRSATQFVAANGSQPLINCISQLLPNYPVLVPQMGYQEHEIAFKRAKHHLLHYPSLDLNEQNAAIEQYLQRFTVDSAAFPASDLKGQAGIRGKSLLNLLIINPNNPTGLMVDITRLNNWATRIAGWLIVDEAFIDLTPEHSLLTIPLANNVLVMRSFGKFFGLAGLRLSFLFANQRLLSRIARHIDIWQVNGVAQFAAQQALPDIDWQQRSRELLLINMQRQSELLAHFFRQYAIQSPQAVTALFICYRLSRLRALHIMQGLAQRGILLRLIAIDDQSSLLRFGIVASEQQFFKLQSALQQLISENA